MSGKLHAPADLTPDKEPPVLIQYEAGGVPEPALAFCPAKNLIPDRPADKSSQYTHDCHIPALSWPNTWLNRVTGTVKTSYAPEGRVECHTGRQFKALFHVTSRCWISCFGSQCWNFDPHTGHPYGYLPQYLHANADLVPLKWRLQWSSG